MQVHRIRRPSLLGRNRSTKLKKIRISKSYLGKFSLFGFVRDMQFQKEVAELLCRDYEGAVANIVEEPPESALEGCCVIS